MLWGIDIFSSVNPGCGKSAANRGLRCMWKLSKRCSYNILLGYKSEKSSLVEAWSLSLSTIWESRTDTTRYEMKVTQMTALLAIVHFINELDYFYFTRRESYCLIKHKRNGTSRRLRKFVSHNDTTKFRGKQYIIVFWKLFSQLITGCRPSLL